MRQNRIPLFERFADQALIDFCDRHGIEYDKLHTAGSGDFGTAYYVDDLRVLKVTSSKSEVELSKARMLKPKVPVLDVIVYIYVVEVIDETGYILMERLEEDSDIEQDYYQLEQHLQQQDLHMSQANSNDDDDFPMDDNLVEMADFIDDAYRAYSYLGCDAPDIKPDNMGVSDSGKYKIFDLHDKSADNFIR